MTSSIYAIEDVIHVNETISSITLDLAGNNYENPVVTIDPPTLGTTATATAVSQGPLFALNLINRGNNYTSTPTVTITGTGTLATASAKFGVVNNIPVEEKGGGYTSATVTIDAPPSPGVRATATANVVEGGVDSITIDEKGSGYATEPNVVISHPQQGSSQARAAATGTFGQVDSISIETNGSGYDNDTIGVTFSGGGGGGATAFATVQGPVQSITVTNGGSGYDANSLPSVTITDNTGPGTGATATAVIEAINAAEDILDNDVVITNDMVKPGGGGILRVYFSFDFAITPATISVFNNNVFKGNFNADNSADVITDGYYRFDIDVEASDNINFQSSENIDTVNFIRTHLVQFGA